MAENENIWLVTGDLGYGLLDAHRDDFPNRFLNAGASEQAAMGICIGLALQGKIPFLYSITTFLLYRPFEWIINYLSAERVPVRLVGSGYEEDYEHDGITHQPWEVHQVISLFHMSNYFPKTKEEIPWLVRSMIEEKQPSFICLRR